MWQHWVVRASTPHEPFQDFETARLFWARLTVVFPDKVAAVLMPNHLHLILPHGDLAHCRHVHSQLGGLLSGVSRQKRLKYLWQSVPPPAEIPDRFHLHRQVRYVALNPCRKQLCEDPLEWYWSTYREVMGADALTSGAVKAAKLAKALGDSKQNFQVRFHAYVSADPSVKVTGTPFPRPTIPSLWAEKSVGEILAAAAGALRVSPIEVKRRGAELRRLFIHMANRHGWKQPRLLGEICGISARAVGLILSQAAPAGMGAADLCLGDDRLRPAGIKAFGADLSTIAKKRKKVG